MIRKVTQKGEVSKFAELRTAIVICHYKKDNCFYVGTKNNIISRVSILDQVQPFAGTGQSGYCDGPTEKSQFHFPCGIDVDQQTGDVYVADINHVIRKISQGQVSTVAGTEGERGCVDGDKRSSRFDLPQGLCFSQHHQALFICDTNNNKLRKVTLANGVTTTICEVESPSFVTVLPKGYLLILSGQILSLSVGENNNEPLVFAGTKGKGALDGQPLESSFDAPCSIALYEKTNTCFVVDRLNYRIRAIKCV